MARYSVVNLPGSTTRYVILDRAADAFCALPDDPAEPHPNLLPLEWRSPHGAEAWLQKCYQRWESGTTPAPDEWRTWSPWESNQVVL